jgi:uncharacterized membrane protein YccF (DUF307 family)
VCAFALHPTDGWIIIIIIIIITIFTLPAQASQWAARVGFSSGT